MTRLARAQAALAVTGWSAPPSRHLQRQQLHSLCGCLKGAEGSRTAQEPSCSEQRSGIIASSVLLSQRKLGMHTQPRNPAPHGDAEVALAVLTLFVIKDLGLHAQPSHQARLIVMPATLVGQAVMAGLLSWTNNLPA